MMKMSSANSAMPKVVGSEILSPDDVVDGAVVVPDDVVVDPVWKDVAKRHALAQRISRPCTGAPWRPPSCAA